MDTSKGSAGAWQRERRGEEAVKAILTRVNAEGLKALRMLAVERDTTLQALCIESGFQ